MTPLSSAENSDYQPGKQKPKNGKANTRENSFTTRNISISSRDGADDMDHANYTSYPKNLPIKHYKDLNETFNSQDPKIKGQTDRPHNATVDRL